jgi:hypothetical protein
MSLAPPTLDDVLARSDDDASRELIASSRRYVLQAREADDAAKERIRVLLDRMWPADGLASAISEEDGTSTTQPQAYAVFTLGPAVDLVLSPERWAQVACSAVVFAEQRDWLRSQYQTEAARVAAQCEADDVRTWEQILGGVPPEEPIPEELVAALLERMRTLSREDDALYLPYVGRRLSEAGHLAAVEELSRVDATFAARLLPSLAAAGNVDAAASLLDEVRAAIEGGDPPNRLDLEWLEGVRDTSLLPRLFACLGAALALPRANNPFGPVQALVSAIGRIGGAEAVARYDELIASSDAPAFRFMRSTRDEVAQECLKRTGQEAAPAAAQSLDLPFLEAG